MIVGITGAGGFIGKELLKKQLELGNSVRVLTRNPKSTYYNSNVTVCIGDITIKDDRLSHFVDGLDVLYHCAAEIRDESKMYLVNVQGVKNLIDLSINKIKHWIQLSSTGVYGPLFEGTVTEKSIPNPQNIYEKSKLESDYLVIEAGSKNYFNYTILRPSIVYGPEMSNQSLFQLINSVDRNFFFFVGKKNALVNYVPVENVLTALILCLQNSNSLNKIYIISEVNFIEDFIKLIQIKLGKKNSPLRIPLFLIMFITFCLKPFKTPLTKSRVMHLTNRANYSIDLISSELNYIQPITTSDAVFNMVNKYLKNK